MKKEKRTGIRFQMPRLQQTQSTARPATTLDDVRLFGLRDLEDLPLLDEPNADETYLQLGFAPLRVSDEANGRGADGQPLVQEPPVDEFDPEMSAAEGEDSDDTALSEASEASEKSDAGDTSNKKRPTDG